MAYSTTASRPDRIKALVAVLLVHAGLAVAILGGLDVSINGIERDRPTTVAIMPETLPPPEPIEPPRPDESSAAKDEAAPPNLKSKPAPVVVPEPAIPLPIEPPVRTAEVKGPEGADRTAGAAATAGPGTGAGGTGSGFGGGGRGGSGAGTGGGETPARLIQNLRHRDYRQIVAGRLPTGRAAMDLRIDPAGRVAGCRVVGSSGDAVVDAQLCPLVQRRLRFRPARDASGRPISQQLTYTATWRPS